MKFDARWAETPSVVVQNCKPAIPQDTITWYSSSMQRSEYEERPLLSGESSTGLSEHVLLYRTNQNR